MKDELSLRPSSFILPPLQRLDCARHCTKQLIKLTL
jgi:hypothetical protein